MPTPTGWESITYSTVKNSSGQWVTYVSSQTSNGAVTSFVEQSETVYTPSGHVSYSVETTPYGGQTYVTDVVSTTPGGESVSVVEETTSSGAHETLTYESVVTPGGTTYVHVTGTDLNGGFVSTVLTPASLDVVSSPSIAPSVPSPTPVVSIPVPTPTRVVNH